MCLEAMRAEREKENLCKSFDWCKLKTDVQRSYWGPRDPAKIVLGTRKAAMAKIAMIPNAKAVFRAT